MSEERVFCVEVDPEKKKLVGTSRWVRERKVEEELGDCVLQRCVIGEMERAVWFAVHALGLQQ